MGTHFLPTIDLLYLKILSEFSEVTILFNKDVLLLDDRINLSPVKLWNEMPSPEVLMIKPEQNATIVTNIDTNVQELSNFVNFIGIDASVIPNRLHELNSDDSRIESDMQVTTKGYQWSINVDSSLVTMGGLVSLRIVERFQKGPVLQTHVGKTMYIFPDRPGTVKAPFQPNSVGLLSLYKDTGQTVEVKNPIGAIWCYAFGNPSPKTNIIRYSTDGTITVLKGHVYNIGQYDAAQVVTIRNISRADAGQYMCEARSGNNLAIEPIVLSVT